MQRSKRLETLKAYIEKHKDVQIQELTSLIENVSESTIRRDLKALAQSGFLNEHYGSVVYSEKNQPDIFIDERLEKNLDAKNVIGKKAAGAIADNDFIYVDAGTTTIYIIKHIKAKNVTVITNGIHVATECAKHGVTVYLLGGELKHTTMAVVGEQTLEALTHYQFDACFIGANGYTDKNYSTPDIKEGILKRYVIKQSRKKYVCCDTSKMHVHTAYVFAKREDCELISEQ